MSSQLQDFLSANEITTEQVIAESKAAEKLSSADRELYVKRSDARREKKKYDEVEASKPAGLRRGVSKRTLQLALDGKPITRVNRKKITRAVERALAGKTDVDVLKLFGDVKSRNHKAKADDED